MQFSLRPLVVLVALVSLSNFLIFVNSVPVEDDDGVEDQIEQPPEDDLGLDELDNVNDMEGIEDDPDFEYADGQQDQDDADDGNDDDIDDGPVSFDIDYSVKRPMPEPECKADAREEVVGQAIKCKEEQEKKEASKPDLKPYEKYKGYKKWERRPLFVIIIGGLRWDYLHDSKWNMTGKTVGKMKAFNWIKKHGSTLSQVVPVYPPYDLPTWTSLATGLYPKETGVTGDYMYNLDSFELFNRGDPGANLDNWWVKGDPIWSLATKHKRKVSVLNWHDCTLPGKTLNITKDCEPFKPSSRPHLV